MLMRSRNLFLSLVWCLVSVLCGCATTPGEQVVESRPPSDQIARPNEGILVVSITNNSAQVNQFDSMFVEQIIDNPDPKKPVVKFQIRQVSRGMARDTALFMGVVKEGKYRISSLYDEKTFKTMFLSTSEKSPLGIFHVKPGEVTDLGRIISTPVNFKLFAGRSALVVSNRDLVKSFSPDNASVYAGESNINTWDNARSDSDIFEDFALTHPIGTTSIIELHDGSVAAVTRLGTILLRGQGGRWSAKRSGHLESILWAAPVAQSDAVLVACGEFNTILKLTNDGKVVVLNSGNLPPGNLLFITGNEKVGWFVAHQEGESVVIYKSVSLDQPNWERLAQEKIGFNFWSGAQQFWAWSTINGFAYAITKGNINYYNFDASSWSNRHAPNNNNIVGLTVSPNNVLGVLTSPGGGVAGIFASTYYTRDEAQNWIETKSPYSVKASAPAIASDGAIFEVGGVFGGAGIQLSRDSGKTWVFQGKKDDNSILASRIWATANHGLFKISGGETGVEYLYHSDNDGSTWSLEYTSFDRKLYEAQKEAPKQ